MDLFDRIEDARTRWDVLTHPFYQRWTAGTLSRAELATYAAQYRHAVEAVAVAAEGLADTAPPARRAELAAHAAEERAHVALWDGFAGAVGAPAHAEATPETAACAQAWAPDGSFAERAAALYAIEAAQPAISETKLRGLVASYGMAAGDAGTAYFALHAERDVEHAAEGRELLAEEAGDADADALVARAETALEANWKLLDGVERLGAKTP